jgi:hypothetical protein
MSQFGRLVRAAGCAALTAAGAAPATAQYPTPYPAPIQAPGVARVAPDAADAAPDLLGVGHHRRAAPPGYYYAPPADCPPGAPAPGTMLPGMAAPGMAAPGMATPGLMPPTSTPSPAPAPSGLDLVSGADAGPSVGLGGYIDNALPVTMFRLRYDSSYGNNRPDRGEFFYAKCGCFNTRDAHGPPLPERNVDSQDLYSYMEYAISPRLSVFGNIPVRFINPDVNTNAAGISDLQFGGKYAFLYGPTRVMSLQLKVIVPTGRTVSGLGTGNTWLEPGILYQEQLSSRWQVFGQLKDQIPLDRQSDFTGNILTYGLGTSYTVASGSWGYIAPVGEVVGWTLLSGRELNPDSGMDVPASGDTIVNGKVGMRVGFGQSQLGQPYPTRSDLYVGYGRALTGEVWYKNMLRVEYRWFF